MTETDDLHAQIRRLIGEIEAWMHNDEQGYDVAIHLLHDAKDKLEQASAALVGEAGTPQIDNGNPYIFCDWVGKHGCVRGAGHNGPHIEWTDAPIPLAPLMARAAVVRGEDGWQQENRRLRDALRAVYYERFKKSSGQNDALAAAERRRFSK